MTKCSLDLARRDDSDPSSLLVEFVVPDDLAFFRGHFAGDPLLPGVVQLEAALLPEVERHWPQLSERNIRFQRVKFLRPIRPGERLVLRVSGPTSSSSRASFELSVADQTCTKGLLLFER